jgi:hypothetical protein
LVLNLDPKSRRTPGDAWPQRGRARSRIFLSRPESEECWRLNVTVWLNNADCTGRTIGRKRAPEALRWHRTRRGCWRVRPRNARRDKSAACSDEGAAIGRTLSAGATSFDRKSPSVRQLVLCEPSARLRAKRFQECEPP